MIKGERGLGAFCCLAMTCVAVFGAPAAADTIVTFPDAHLEAGIRTALGISAPTPVTATDMLGLTSLSVPFTGIADLTGIQYATNLTKLWVGGNNISTLAPVAGLGNLTFLEMEYLSCTVDLAPLAGLFRLETLVADMNGILDITALSGLTSLHSLSLQDNLITDIGPLRDLPEIHRVFLMNNRIAVLPAMDVPLLYDLRLDNNEISDISSFAASNLQRLDQLDLQGNPLNQAAYDIFIPQLQASYPGMRILYDPLPEPGTCALIVLGTTLGVAVRRRSRRRTRSVR